MYFLQKILFLLFILISGSLKAGEVTDLYENEEFYFIKTFNCGNSIIKIKKPDWLEIT